MSGSMYLVGEIIVFMALATLIGFGFGRLTGRKAPSLSNAEMTALRERTTLLEREVDELTAALVDARASSGDAAAQERAQMAEREAAGLGRRLDEAAQRIEGLQAERDEWMALAEAAAAESESAVANIDDEGHDGVVSAEEAAETQELREELERRTAHIARLEQVAADAKRLEQELEARNDRIGQLERVLEANAADRAIREGNAASIGISLGAGTYADSRLTFDPTDGS